MLKMGSPTAHGTSGGGASKPRAGRAQEARASRLFIPYRAVGLITDGAPFHVNRLGDRTFITTSIGDAFQVR